MEDYFYLNPSKMLELSRELTGSEMRVLLAMMYCMASSDTDIFINNRKNREKMEEVDFKRSPERICLILSSLVKKEILKREATGVYRLPENLFILSSEKEVKITP